MGERIGGPYKAHMDIVEKILMVMMKMKLMMTHMEVVKKVLRDERGGQ